MRILVGLMLGALVLQGCAAPEASGPLTARVTVQADGQGRVVPAGLFGTNLQWEHEGDGLLRGQKGGSIPAPVLQEIQGLRPTSIRFPGGALANTYRWKHGVGASAVRPTGTSYGGQSVASIFGTDEFIQLLAATGAVPLITVNLNAGAEEAADWVDYLNGAATTAGGALRQKNAGVNPPRAVYWEIGNELYSPNEPGHLSPEAYAARLGEFARTMKKRDPAIKIGAIMEASFQEAGWLASVLPGLATWNEKLLKALGPEVDFLSLHFYTPFDTLGKEADLNRLVWAGPVAFERTLARIREQARASGHPNLEIAVTEYGTFFGEKVTLNPRIASTENALFNTLLMMSFMRAPDVTIANNWSLVNNSQFGMLSWEGGKLGMRPWREAWLRLRDFAGARLVPVEVQSEGYAVAAKGNVPAIAQLAAIDAVAVRSDRGWRLALVNRSPEREVDVALDSRGGPLPDDLDMTTLIAERGGKAFAQPGSAKLARTPGKTGYRIRLPAQSIVFLDS